MRRQLSYAKSGRRRVSFVYACCLLALLAIGVRKMVIAPGIGGTFWVLWVLFAGLAIAANLYFLFGADRERSRLLEQREETAALRRPVEARGERRVRRRGV